MTVFEMYKQYGLSAGSSGFGPRPTFGDYHWGVDFKTPVGVSIHAHMDCILRLSGTYSGEVIINMEALDGSCNWTIGHCSEAIYRAGTTVKAGTLVGKTGNSGRSTGPHAHWEYDRGRFKGSVTANHNAGTTIDPLPIIKQGGATGAKENMTYEEVLSDWFDVIANDPWYAESRPEVFRNHVEHVKTLDWAGRRAWLKQVMADNGVMDKNRMAEHLAAVESAQSELQGQLQAANQTNANLRATIDQRAQEKASQAIEAVQNESFKAAYRTQSNQEPSKAEITQWRQTDLSADAWVRKFVPNADVIQVTELLDAARESIRTLNDTIEAQQRKMEDLATEVRVMGESLTQTKKEMKALRDDLGAERLTSESLRTQLLAEQHKSKPVNQLTIIQLITEVFSRLRGGAKA